MIWMRLVIRIVMSTCVSKIMGAISIHMNVEAIEGRNIIWRIERQMKKFRIENYTFIWCIIKSDDSRNVGVGLASVYQSVCIGRCIHYMLTNGKRIRKYIHIDSN